MVEADRPRTDPIELGRVGPALRFRLARSDHTVSFLVIASAILFCASIVILFLCMNRYVNPFDEGIVLTGAMRVKHGALIHRDFYVLYGPGQFYVLAWLFTLFPPSVLVERVWDTVVNASIVVLIFLIVVRSTYEVVGWMAGFISLVWLASFGFYGYPVFPALAMILGSLLFLMLTFRGSNSRVPLFAAGICVALSTLFRYDVGVAAFGVEGGLLGAFAVMQQPAKRVGERVRRLFGIEVPFCAGMGLIIVPVAVTYLANGIVSGFLFDIIYYPTNFYWKMRSLPFPSLIHPTAWCLYLPLVVSASALVIAAAKMRHQRGPRAMFWTTVTLVTLTVAFFVKGAVRPSSIQMSMAILTSVVLIGLIVDCWPESRGGMLLVAAVPIVLLGLTTLNTARYCVFFAHQNLSWLASGAPCDHPMRLTRLGCFETDSQRIAAIRFVRDRTKPDEPIFVGLDRYDKIFINDIVFYFLAGRQPATKWYEMDPGLQTSVPIQRQIITDLQRERPRYIVVESQWDNESEPNGSAVSSGVKLLEDYISRTYVKEAQYGSISVLQYCQHAQPANTSRVRRAGGRDAARCDRGRAAHASDAGKVAQQIRWRPRGW